MEFNQEAVKRIRGLIVFAALVVLCFWRYDIILDVLRFIIHVIFPFLLGGAIAFVLNVPMNFIQRHLFRPERIEGKKYLQKLARPVSMLLVLCWRDRRDRAGYAGAGAAAGRDIYQSGEKYPAVSSEAAGLGERSFSRQSGYACLDQ